MFLKIKEVYNNLYQYKDHILFFLIIGLILRVFSAFHSYGFLALDDFTHYFENAWLFHITGKFVGNSLRDPILTLFIWFSLKLGTFLGIVNKILMLQFVSLLLALFSLFAIWGTYLYCLNKAVNKKE